MITFKIAKHHYRKCEIVEVYNDGRFIATLTPDSEDTAGIFHMHSSHLYAFGIDNEAGWVVIPPGVHTFSFAVTETDSARLLEVARKIGEQK